MFVFALQIHKLFFLFIKALLNNSIRIVSITLFDFVLDMLLKKKGGDSVFIRLSILKMGKYTILGFGRSRVCFFWKWLGDAEMLRIVVLNFKLFF